MKIRDLSQLPWEAVSHEPKAIGAGAVPAPICKRVMLRRGELPHLMNFAQACFEPGQVAAVHLHLDMAEVFWVIEGCGVIEVEGQVQPLRPGICVVVEPGERHEVRNIGRQRLILSYFGLQIESGDNP